MSDERHIEALRRECGFYIATGRLENARLVNEQLTARGVDPVPLPEDAPVKRTAKSAQAATRKKRA